MPLLPTIPHETSLTRGSKVERGNVLDTKMAFSWLQWFRSLITMVNSAPIRIGAVALKSQVAAVAATPVIQPTSQTPGGGLYRVSYYARVETPASVSSALQVTVHWVDDEGIVLSQAGASLTGNLQTTYESQTLLLDVDSASDITYSIGYTSVGTPMAYEFSMVVEAVTP